MKTRIFLLLTIVTFFLGESLYAQNPTIEYKAENISYEPVTNILSFDFYLRAGQNYVSGDLRDGDFISGDLFLLYGSKTGKTYTLKMTGATSSRTATAIAYAIDCPAIGNTYNFMDPTGLVHLFLDRVSSNPGSAPAGGNKKELSARWLHLLEVEITLDPTSILPDDWNDLTLLPDGMGVSAWGNIGERAQNDPIRAGLEFVYGTCPSTTKWLGNGPAIGTPTSVAVVNDPWNDHNNWSNMTPGDCTDAIIGAGAAEYPELTSESQAVCNTIHFEFGGEVKGMNHLTYNTASYDLTMEHDKWHMLANPLAETFSGDYYTDAPSNRTEPAIYMRKWQAENPQNDKEKAKGKWTKSFRNLDALITLQDGGVIARVDKGKSMSNNFTYTFPKTDTKYYYYDGWGTIIDESHWQFNDHKPFTINRTQGVVGKLAYQTALPYVGSYDPNDGSFLLDIVEQNTQEYTQLIAPNPFMSHLDIVEFWKGNRTKITKDFYIFNGSQYLAYQVNSTEDGITSSNGAPGTTIAPLQAFFVTKTVNSTFAGLAYNEETMTKIDVSADGKLKAPQSNANSDNLYISVYRNEVKESSTALIYDEKASVNYVEGEDAWTLFPPSAQVKSAIVYSLAGDGAVSINTNNLSTEIPLGIRVDGLTDDLTLKFTNNNSFASGQELYLIERDPATGTLVRNYDLRNTPSITFSNASGENVENRFWIHRSKVITNDNGNNTTDVFVSGQQGKVLIESIGADIVTVRMYNLAGQELQHSSRINRSLIELPAPSNSVVMVQVVTSTGKTVSHKVIVK